MEEFPIQGSPTAGLAGLVISIGKVPMVLLTVAISITVPEGYMVLFTGLEKMVP